MKKQTPKEQQISTTRIKGKIVYLDVSTKKLPFLEMVWDLSDYTSWRDNESLGRIGARSGKTTKYPYANCWNKLTKKQVKVHRLVKPELECIDHVEPFNEWIDKGLNNLRRNLRDGSSGVNNWNQVMQSTNTSGYRGVHWDHQIHRFKAQIGLNGKKRHLGLFKTALAASHRYELAYKRRGEGYAILEL